MVFMERSVPQHCTRPEGWDGYRRTTSPPSHQLLGLADPAPDLTGSSHQSAETQQRAASKAWVWEPTLPGALVLWYRLARVRAQRPSRVSVPTSPTAAGNNYPAETPSLL